VSTVADFIVERLAAWGVTHVFGYSGDAISGILGALDRTDANIQLIQSRHEEMSAFMACGFAKFTGELGVCLATSGPGAIHLLNGLYDAKADHQPVLAIVGQQARTSLGGDFQQEVDLLSLFKDVAKDYVHVVSVPEQVAHTLDRAIRIALAQRSPTCLIIPSDVQELDAVEEPPREHGMVRSGIGYRQPVVVPTVRDLKRTAEILNAGERVAILAGAGALHAGQEVIEVAELLGAGVATALLGKAVVPNHLPFVTGAIGLLGTRPSWEMMENCDTLLMVGSDFPYSEFLPPSGQARGVQIDLNAGALSTRYPMDITLVGDSRATLQALIPLIERKSDRAWRSQLEEGVREWWRTIEQRAMVDADPVNPQRVVWELDQRLPDGCIVTADSGTATVWYARDLRLRPGMLGSTSGGLASMGCAVPYAIAAKFAHPDRPVVALAGDGAMQMNGNSELLTVAQYWRHWDDPRLIVLVLNNQDLNFVTWEMRVKAGNPKFDDAQYVPDFRYADYARMVGLNGARVEHPDAVGPAWDEALRSDRPFVLEAVTDPAVPPMPPHVTVRQAKDYALAMLKGDSEAVQVIKQSLKEMAANVLPGRGDASKQ
jgi:pyruvate dehydrogenase (quinone)